MSQGAIAKRYAQALFELGDEAGELKALSEQITEFAKTYTAHRQLALALSNPVMSHEEARSLLTAVAKKVGVSELGIRSLLVMAQRRRLSSIAATAERLRELCDIKQGLIRAEVVTAAEMPNSYFDALKAQLESATSKKVVLKTSIDASLVGGAIVRVGDTVIDGSVRGQLEKVEKKLLAAVAAGVN